MTIKQTTPDIVSPPAGAKGRSWKVGAWIGLAVVLLAVVAVNANGATARAPARVMHVRYRNMTELP